MPKSEPKFKEFPYPKYSIEVATGAGQILQFSYQINLHSYLIYIYIYFAGLLIRDQVQWIGVRNTRSYPKLCKFACIEWGPNVRIYNILLRIGLP